MSVCVKKKSYVAQTCLEFIVYPRVTLNSPPSCSASPVLWLQVCVATTYSSFIFKNLCWQILNLHLTCIIWHNMFMSFLIIEKWMHPRLSKLSSWSLSISCYVQFASPSQGNTWWPLCHCRSAITSRVFYKGTTFTLSYFCPSLSLSIILLRITPVTNCSQEEEVGGGWELGFWGSVLQVITFPCVKAFVFGVELFLGDIQMTTKVLFESPRMLCF